MAGVSVVEHWVVAEHQGQKAARNILSRWERFDAVPFFWAIQYHSGPGSIDHAKRFDTAALDGSLDQRNYSVTYRLAAKGPWSPSCDAISPLW